MKLLKAQPLIALEQAQLQQDVAGFCARHGRAPHLALVLVGQDPASVLYTRRKAQAADRLGITHETRQFPVTLSAEDLQQTLTELNTNPLVDGILLQRPCASAPESALRQWIDPSKDVDGFHPWQAGLLSLGQPSLVPCTPAGILGLLQFYQIPVAGKLACIVGRSPTVGRPLAHLLLQADATVLQCHSRTQGLAGLTRLADILVVAIGRQEFVTGAMIAPGCTVIDVGIHPQGNGKVLGDVHAASVSEKASALSPVPGGVGPMTIHCLMKNTLSAAQAREATQRRTRSLT